jgi:hypothetical protein
MSNIVMWRATRCGGWVRRWREGQRALLDGVETMSAPAFRANVGERLRSLERELAEVRTRVNGLLFVMAGTAVTQVLLRILA